MPFTEGPLCAEGEEDRDNCYVPRLLGQEEMMVILRMKVWWRELWGPRGETLNLASPLGEMHLGQILDNSGSSESVLDSGADVRKVGRSTRGRGMEEKTGRASGLGSWRESS